MKAAVFTMAYNEAVFLPMWIAHYAKQLGRENLFVVDAGSTDDSTSGLDVNCIRVPRATLDEERRTAFVHHFHASLLSYYDVVIFADTDEFFVADPAFYPDLVTFLKDRPEERLAGIGVNVTHVLDVEAALQPDKPVLMQRQHVQFDSLYCKPNIGRKPIAWTPGFHSCSGGYTMSTLLYLFHLKAVDQELFFRELCIKKQGGLSEGSIAKGHGVQMAMQHQELIKIYFPNTATTLSQSLTDDFKFQADLTRFAQQGFRGIWSSKGAVAKVPIRFQRCLPSLTGLAA